MGSSDQAGLTAADASNSQSVDVDRLIADRDALQQRLHLAEEKLQAVQAICDGRVAHLEDQAVQLTTALSASTGWWLVVAYRSSRAILRRALLVSSQWPPRGTRGARG